MRLVAGITGQAGGVFCRSHLRESFGFRCVCFVAAGAEYRCIEFVWFYGPRVIRVHGQRPVACFAIHMRVLAVFRPAGSPAEAYYPDGTPAVYGPEN